MESLTDILVIGLSILGLVVAFMLRMAFETWQFTRNKMHIVTNIGRRGAVDPASARPLEEMGLRVPSWRLGLRDYQAETMRVLLRTGFVHRTADGRFYLSPEAYDFYAIHCDR